jgi:tetratricopeptide (TPR) repeat protein
MKPLQTLLLVMFAAHGFAAGQVRVWQGTLTLPTYEEGTPDPNPPFDQYANNRFNYPYTMRHNLTDRRVDHAWRAVYIENEYLKCSVLPDIGGHLYTCTDKISGKPMFYENPSIKKADVAYRGAWAAFGIEFNFPVSHNWVTASPVDFSYAKNGDGSASVQVGNIDRVYGMQWTVELILRPRSTVLEERITLNNRSDARHRFYWWNNAGVQVWDDSRIEYPMRFAASHGFREVQRWPLEADGNDLSIVKNHTKGPVSLFVHGSREPFMGVWHPHTNTGIVHFADYAQLPAKKIWSWGSDADGLDWRKALSDNNSAYVEVQAGLFRNQETYAFLEPRQTIRFSEFWMPAREIGGITRANLAGVVNLARTNDALQVALNVNQPLADATVQILNGKQKVFETRTSLVPEHAWSHQIANPDPQAKYTFELRDRNAVLLRHTEGEYDWTPVDQIHLGPQPTHAIPDAQARTEDDWLQLGEEQELNGRLLAAIETYNAALKAFPSSFSLRKSAGRLSASLLRFEDARQDLENVHEWDTTDAEVSYYLGLAYEGMGDTRNAREKYEAAYRMPEFKAAAGVKLAELAAREHNLRQAQQYLEGVVGHDSGDLRAAEELSAVLKAAGETAAAERLRERWLAQFPQRYFLLEETGRPALEHLANDSERVLNVASEYMRLGLYSQALNVLSRQYPPAVPDETEPGALAPEKHPLVAYYRGYCKQKLGESPDADLDLAARLSTAYVFPQRQEDLEVLQAAAKTHPQDATAHYLLGTLYFSRGITDEALTHWAEARKLNPERPVLHASLGRALLRVKNNPEEALAVFQEGLSYDPTNVELYTGIDQSLSILRRPAAERVAALERYPDRAKMPSPLVYELILNLAEAGRYEEARDLFRNRFFQREEGGTNVRQVWIEVNLQKAMALAGEGKCSDAISTVDHLEDSVPEMPFTHDGLTPLLHSARVTYLLGNVYKTCHAQDKAEQSYRHAAEQSGIEDRVWSWKALQELNPSGTSKQDLERVVEKARSTSDISSRTGWWLYNLAMLDRALGNKAQAESEFRDALLYPDQLLTYHLTRIALASENP